MERVLLGLLFAFVPIRNAGSNPSGKPGVAVRSLARHEKRCKRTLFWPECDSGSEDSYSALCVCAAFSAELRVSAFPNQVKAVRTNPPHITAKG